MRREGEDRLIDARRERYRRGRPYRRWRWGILPAYEHGGEAMASPKYRPGTHAPKSGQYPLVGPRGGPTGQEVTVVEGRPLPPTPKPGMGYGKPDKTKHKG